MAYQLGTLCRWLFMRIGPSPFAAQAPYERPRAGAPKATGVAQAEAVAQQVAAANDLLGRMARVDTEKKFDPALLDWFVFLRARHPGSDPTVGVEGAEEIRRLYKQAGPSYVARPVAKATKAAAKAGAAFDVVA